MKTLALIAAATAVIATTTAASAHDYDRQDGIDARRAEQAYRIRHNRRSGELTLLEKWRLQGEQRRIAAMERSAKRRRQTFPLRTNPSCRRGRVHQTGRNPRGGGAWEDRPAPVHEGMLGRASASDDGPGVAVRFTLRGWPPDQRSALRGPEAASMGVPSP